MSLRELVTGSDACTTSDGAGPSNAVGTLVNTLLGRDAKTREHIGELPVHQAHRPPPNVLNPEAAAAFAASSSSTIAIPGVGPSAMGVQSHVDALLGGVPPPDVLDDFEAIYNQGMAQPPPPHAQQQAPGPPPVLGGLFQDFLSAARSQAPFQPPPLPDLHLSVADQCRIRDRATILSRHLLADMGDGFADQQVGHLLASLNIHPLELPAELPFVHDADWHSLWQQGAGGPQLQEGPLGAEMAAAARDHWEHVWQQQQQQGPLQGPPPMAGPGAWAEEFHQQQPVPQQWAQEFEQEAAAPSGVSSSAAQAEAVRHSHALAATLSRDADPKMRNSKFLQFVSKMSKGELLLEDNQVVPAAGGGAAWADEFASSLQGPAGQQAAPGWMPDFAQAQERLPVGGQQEWADEFAKQLADLDLGGSSLAEMEAAWKQAEAGGAGQPSWVDEFEDDQQQVEWSRIFSPEATVAPPRTGEYQFAEVNPFLNDPDALAKGKELFKKGLLSEACLALEAEVQARPANSEGWRLLGTVNAENDDDLQAIAALGRALQSDPNDLDVLLSLGVSHTNELDHAEALSYLGRWIHHHPQHRGVAESCGPPLDSSQAQSHLIRVFETASGAQPDAVELQMGLGVLYHLGRNYQQAVDAFKRALELRPLDYSLWNKLGATLANHSHSSEAISAYRQALDLKPNYMRAWTNMGIGFANLGDYDSSARYYIRALSMNPNAPHVWSYLRTSLVCCKRTDLLDALEEHNLDALTQAMPL